MPDTPLLEMRDIHKSFFGVKVLDDVSLVVHQGEVHALLGENGAGKSTLIKILNGDYEKDSGEIRINGNQVDFKQPRDAEMQGIRMIYQELHYAPDLSVSENLMLGNLPTKSGLLGRFIVDWKRMREIASERLQLLALDISPDSKMRELTVVERQIVEIVKALSADARIIVMDEPTAALTPPEVIMLFKIIGDLQERGVSIIYISHRLDEVFEIAQRVTILRDGKHIGTHPVKDLTMASVVEMMVGHEIQERNHEIELEATAQKPKLEVKHLTQYGKFEDVSFEVRAGEILGIFGLIGSGQISLTRSIFGAEHIEAGQVLVNGEPVTIRNPRDAKGAGIGFVPIDRKIRGLIMGQSVRKNVTLSNWGKLTQMGFFKQGMEKEHTQTWVDVLGIRMAGGMEMPIRFLSGGNQQKAILARWLEANITVLILNEPTWGVDVGARSDIYDQLEKMASQGLAVLVISSDIQEVLSISHRILTMYQGKITANFNHGVATKDSLLAAAAGETM